MKSRMSHRATTFRTLLELQALYNCPMNNNTATRSPKLNRLSFAIVSMRLNNFFNCATVFSLKQKDRHGARSYSSLAEHPQTQHLYG